MIIPTTQLIICQAQIEGIPKSQVFKSSGFPKISFPSNNKGPIEIKSQKNKADNGKINFFLSIKFEFKFSTDLWNFNLSKYSFLSLTINEKNKVTKKFAKKPQKAEYIVNGHDPHTTNSQKKIWPVLSVKINIIKPVISPKFTPNFEILGK